MGYWPSFHDADVLSASRDGDRCVAILHVFQMTNEVDERGYFVLTRHHRVHLEMTGVSECSLPVGYDSDTLFELLIEGSEGALTVAFNSVTDQNWRVTCREVCVHDVVPCGPRGELAE
jgi:hypothetical protein